MLRSAIFSTHQRRHFLCHTVPCQKDNRKTWDKKAMLFSPASFACQRQSLKRHKKPRHPNPCKVLYFRKCLAPWEPLPLTPPRASQPTRSSYFGGYLAAAPIIPPPRRRASPTTKKNCCVCSLRQPASHNPLKNRKTQTSIRQPLSKAFSQKTRGPAPVANPS